LVANWAPKLKGYDKEVFAINLEKTINSLLNANKQVYLLSDIPQFEFDPQRCKYLRPLSKDVKCEMPSTMAQAQWAEYGVAMVALQKKFPSIQILDLNLAFCTADVCSMAQEKQLYYRDNNHLNIDGSQYLGLHIVDNLKIMNR
jgi:lysophospholipase L1-like esterase